MEVFIYRGLSSVASIDFACLRTIALIKLCNAPVKINADGNPFHSPNGLLPYLRTEDGAKIAGYTQIVAHLRAEGHCTNLSEKNTGLSDGYTALLASDLRHGLDYQLWGDPQNADSTRLLYAKRTPFPFSFWYPQQYIRRTDRAMQALEDFSLEDKLVDHNTDGMLLAARKCLNLLEAKIAGTLCVLSAGPTELDCALYAYLAICQHVLPHNNVLRTHLAECKRLMQFVQKFRYAYFPADGELMRQTLARVDRQEEQRLNGTATTADLDDERTAKWVPQLLAATIAFGAMTLFAYKQGIFQMAAAGSSRNGGEYDGDYGDDDDDESGNDD